MEKLNRFERFFHNKYTIRGIFIFPLISIVIIALAISNFLQMNGRVIPATNLRHLFVWVLVLLCINMVANFSALVLYYCLSNRVDDFNKKYGNKKAL